MFNVTFERIAGAYYAWPGFPHKEIAGSRAVIQFTFSAVSSQIIYESMTRYMYISDVVIITCEKRKETEQ